MADEAKLRSPVCSTSEVLVVQSGSGVEKNWARPGDQGQMQALELSVHLTNLPSMLLRCDGFSRIQKAVVDQTGSRPPVTMTFSGASLALGRALEHLSPTTELVTAGCCIKSTFHHASQPDREMARCCLDLRQHFKMTIF